MLEVGEGPRSEPAFQSLDPRVIPLWRVTGGIGSAVLATVLLVGALAFAVPSGIVAWALGAWGLVVVALAAYTWWYPRRAHAAWGWRIDERVLEIRSGVVFRVTRLVPLSRLQHVDLQSGPIERSFGLASLIVHTAGTHDSSVPLPGLDAAAAAALRDHLALVSGDDAV